MLRIIKIVHRHYNPRLSYCTTGHTKEDKAIMEMDVNERVRPQVKDIDHYRNNITDLYYATYSVYPQPVAFIYLFDPDQWKIVGEEAVTPVELDGAYSDYADWS